MSSMHEISRGRSVCCRNSHRAVFAEAASATSPDFESSLSTSDQTSARDNHSHKASCQIYWIEDIRICWMSEQDDILDAL